MAASYKAAKEAFVTGFSGTSMWEVALVISITPLLAPLVLHLAPRKHAFLTDFGFLVLPTLFTACYGSALAWPLIVVAMCVLVCALGARRLREEAPVRVLDVDERGHVVAVSLFRGCVLLYTCVCILAVDFAVFPRRFVKTEETGTSLMDTGVGAFVVANGLTSPLVKARLRGRVRQALRSVLPLLSLGLLRFYLNRAADYQEHVSEYGQHWNFFITIAAVTLLSALCAPAPQRCALAGLCLGVLHQWLLSARGLNDWVLHAPRVSMLTANKEGVVSTLGFLALYLVAVQLGHWMTQRVHPVPDLLLRMLVIACVLWVCTWAVTTYVAPCSRRTANLSYIVWTLAMVVTMLVLLLVGELALGSQPVRPTFLLLCINKNALPVFLGANLMTGAVNLSMRTIEAGAGVSFAVLVLYCLAFCALARAISHTRVRLKPSKKT